MKKRQIDILVSEYYTSWYVYARYLCNRYKMPGEAYDIFMESLTQFLSKTDGTIERLIARENRGEKIMLNYVKVMIKYNVINFYNKQYKAFTLVPDTSVFDYLVTDEDPDNYIGDDKYKTVREIEAQFREDTFSGPRSFRKIPTGCKIHTTLYRSSPKITTDDNGGIDIGLIPYVGRVTYPQNQKRKSTQKRFTTREEAKTWIENFKYELVSNTLNPV